MGPTEVIIIIAILVIFWVIPAILAAHILFVNAAHKWPRLRADICLRSLAIIATPILALCWPVVLVSSCSMWLSSRALASHHTCHGGDGNARHSSAWYYSAWAQIKTGCKRKTYTTEEIPAGYRVDVENQAATHPRLKTQPELVRTGNGQNTGISNHASSHLSLQVERINGMGVAQYAHRSCQTDQDTSLPTYQMALEESVDRAAIPDGRMPLPVYSA